MQSKSHNLPQASSSACENRSFASTDSVRYDSSDDYSAMKISSIRTRREDSLAYQVKDAKAKAKLEPRYTNLNEQYMKVVSRELNRSFVIFLLP